MLPGEAAKYREDDMDFMLNGGQSGAPAASGDWIKDGSIDSFVEDVLEASANVPVIVDFWAPWCGPCKTLGPMLERLVKEAKGAVRLVKIDVDKNQELAAQMRVQSIPAVYGFVGGRPVDGFAGALPESQLKAFIQRLTGGAAGQGPTVAELLAEAQTQLTEGQTELALQIYQDILSQDENNGPALAGMIRSMIKLGHPEAARQLLDTLPPELQAQGDVAAATKALELAEKSSGASGATAGLRQKLEANPNDHQTRFDLAAALVAEGANEEAVDELLDLYRRDRNWNEEAAKKQLLTLFEAFGQADPLTVASRKRLSSLMFS
jgi:putative thioredoxin